VRAALRRMLFLGVRDRRLAGVLQSAFRNATNLAHAGPHVFSCACRVPSKNIGNGENAESYTMYAISFTFMPRTRVNFALCRTCAHHETRTFAPILKRVFDAGRAFTRF
jgi:hypothetical protein